MEVQAFYTTGILKLTSPSMKCIHFKYMDHKFMYCKCKHLKCMHLVFLLVFNLDYCLKAKENLLFYQCRKLVDNLHVQDNPPIKAPSNWVEQTSVGRRYYYNKRIRQSKNLHNLFGSLDRSLIKEVKVKEMEENEDKPTLAMITDANVSCNP
ncbi:hypothetical protein PVL29_022932 [Vitis rotundifolia]|uniref:Uncharacterized protein n=1 Tax=Vitis rotundifolia TaxID=103349 RepID=A0AA39DC63_VITRO|nr:hypothetical protein PVL29_022932 [Vitis rotundifolia]